MPEANTPVLVAVLNNQADWQRIQEQQWYRVPLAHAPRRMAAGILAWYQTKAFGAEGGQIRWYAEINHVSQATRIQLIPEQPEHPRAQEHYWRLQIGALQSLPQPIKAQRFRRITFISTNWQQFIHAKQINDLWLGDSLIEQLSQQLISEGMNVVRRRLHDGNTPPQGTCLLIPLLNQLELQIGEQVLRFEHEDLIWDFAGCLAQIRAIQSRN
ncbi:hypothetical protein [Herpetosiphon llansteffanensis]|uniref:hypothetical protein n=1 Tax=Herpetosiphon llansteffanensis TaxID=2094568 RepID=UPI000D7C79E6|nr:hypothetical protein [Herpetosiphon llansteffanensis]